MWRILLLYSRSEFYALGFLSIAALVIFVNLDSRDFFWSPVRMEEKGEIISCKETSVSINNYPVHRVAFQWMSEDGPTQAFRFVLAPIPLGPCELERCGSDVRPVGTTFGKVGNSWSILIILTVWTLFIVLTVSFGGYHAWRDWHFFCWGVETPAREIRRESTGMKINDKPQYLVFLEFTSPETGEMCETMRLALDSDIRKNVDGTVPILVDSWDRVYLSGRFARVLRRTPSGKFRAPVVQAVLWFVYCAIVFGVAFAIFNWM